MRKEQDKMALESIKQDNVAAAAGYIREIAEIEKICGISFFGYQITLEVKRESKGKDKIIVILPRYAAGLVGNPTIESLKRHCEGKNTNVYSGVFLEGRRASIITERCADPWNSSEKTALSDNSERETDHGVIHIIREPTDKRYVPDTVHMLGAAGGRCKELQKVGRGGIGGQIPEPGIYKGH